MSERPDNNYQHKARRPAITPLFSCAVALWVGTACAYVWARTAEVATLQAAQVPFALLAIVGVGTNIIVKRMGVAGFMAASACLGVSLAFMQALVLMQTSEALAGQQIENAPLTLEADSSAGSFGESVDATLQLPSGRHVLVQARFSDEGALFYGQRFEVSGNLRAIDYHTQDYSWQKGYVAELKVSSSKLLPPEGLRSSLASFRQSAVEALGGQDESLGLIQALACGYRRNIRDTQTYDNFQRCGLAHLVAVSGAHLVIVTSMAAALFKLLRVPRVLSIIVLVGAMVAYVILAGAPISALRALLMSSVGILALFGKRAPSSQNALGLSIFVVLAHAPADALSISFALSALSTCGIVLFAHKIGEWLEGIPLLGAKWARDALALTLASSLLSQLLACSIFNLLPLVSPLANIATTPLFAPLCGVSLFAALAAGCGLPFASVLVTLASWLANITNAIVSALASLSFASVPFTCSTVVGLGLSVLLAVLLWVTWPSRAQGLMALGALSLAGAMFLFWTTPGDSIVMLDVGQGDAILLRSRGHTFLIDTGNKDSQLLGELADERITTLDGLAITHADDDHCGSLDAIRSAVNVDSAFVPSDMLTCEDEKVKAAVREINDTAHKVTALHAGDTFHVGAFTLTVLWPLAYENEGGNGDSLCLWADYDGNDDGVVDFTALFTGDAEAEQLTDIFAAHTNMRVDILKVGHHGSKNALTPEEAQVLQPSVALIGVGAHNRYGHPAQNTLDYLTDVGTNIFRTDTNGTITCKLTAEALKVSTEQ